MAQVEDHIFTECDDFSGFLDQIEGQVVWCREIADEDPEDDRNERVAEALEELAAWVRDNRAAPVVEALNEALDRLYADESAMERFTPAVEERLGRYGFDGPDEPEAWLSDLVQAIDAHVPGKKQGRSEGGTAAGATRGNVLLFLPRAKGKGKGDKR
jgi:hypothetical protein